MRVNDGYILNGIRIFKDKYFKKNMDFNMKLINTITIGGFIASTLNSIIAVLCYSSRILIGVNIFLTIFLWGIFTYTNWKGTHEKSAIVACVVLNMICLPILFMASSGLASSIPMYFLLGIILTFTLVEGRSLIIIVALEILTCTGTYIIRFYQDVTVENWLELQKRTRNNLLGVVIVGVTIGTMFYVQKQIFQKQHDQMEDNKRMLEESMKNMNLAKQEAETANLAKSEFLAKMSHEIRTPMNAILGMTELITREEISKDTRYKAENIQRAAESLLAIINDILDLSKIESGKMEIVNSEYNPKAIFRDVLQIMSFRLEHKPIKLAVHIDKDLPGKLYGDEIRIRQILINILNNAIKYTNEGQVTLNVNWKRQGDFAKLHISVKDTGIGIKPEDLTKLFNSFERVDIKRNHGLEGTGLGLCICKKLLELMNGTIEVKSVYEEGSEFIVELTQRIIELMPMQRSVAVANKGEYASFTAPQAKVLIVDDNKVNLEVAKGLLKTYDLQVETVLSGRECLAVLKDKTYDLIFMDHMMPELDGIETLHIIRKSKLHNGAIIALTANAITGIKEKFMREGFTEYISKPIDVGRLHEILLKYLPAQFITYKEIKETKERVGQGDAIGEIKGLMPYKVLQTLNGDVSLYKELLKVYLKEVVAINNELEGVFKTDINKFKIKVHGIKGTSSNVGALEIAKFGEQLEKAAQVGDIKRIEKELPRFQRQIEELCQEIAKFLSADSPKIQPIFKEKQKQISPQSLDTLQLGFQEMDVDMLTNAISEIRKYYYEKIQENFIEQLQECIENLEYEEGYRLVTSYMKQIA